MLSSKAQTSALVHAVVAAHVGGTVECNSGSDADSDRTRTGSRIRHRNATDLLLIRVIVIAALKVMAW